MAAYAPPEVYRTPTEGTTIDYAFTSDDDDVSFDYSTPHASDNSDNDTFYTDVGDEMAMLKSPGQSEDTPIDLTNSTEAIDLTNSLDGDDGLQHKTSFDEIPATSMRVSIRRKNQALLVNYICQM